LVCKESSEETLKTIPDNTFTPLPINITPAGMELDPETGVDLSKPQDNKSN